MRPRFRQAALRGVAAIVFTATVAGWGAVATGGATGPSDDSTPPSSAPASSAPASSAPASSAPASSAPATASSEPELGELSVDPLDAHLDDAGVLGLAGALSLFAATFAPLPGVAPAAEPALDAGGLILSTITPHLHELAPEVVAVIESMLGDATAVPVDVLAPPTSAAGIRRPGGERTDLAVPILAESAEYFTGRLGRPLPIVLVTVVELPAISDSGVLNFAATEAARATPLYDPDTLIYDECRVALNVDAVYEPRTFRSQIAHEMFHCFQYSVGTGRPAWVQEGAAAYAGEEFAGGTAYSATWWARWVNEPHRALTDRSYDAIGLFALTAALGVDPYTYVDDLLRRPVLDTVSVLVGPRLNELWGLHYVNKASWGSDYTVRGPAAPSSGSPLIPLNVTVDGAAALFTHLPAAIREAAQVYALETPGDVLTVDASRSTGGIRFENGTDIRFPANVEVCLRPDGCACPSGEAGSTLPLGSPGAFIGLGPFDLSPPIVTAESLAHWCDDGAATTAAPVACHVGSWVTTSYELPALPMAATASEGGGGVAVTFGADGTFVADYSGMQPITSSAAIEDAPGVSLTVQFTGTLTGSWTIDGGGVLRVGSGGGDVRVLATAAVAGTETPIIDSPLAELIGAFGSAFLTLASCAGDSMVLTTDFPGWSQRLTLSRVG